MILKIMKTLLIFFTAWFILHLLIILIVGLNNNVDKADVILIFGNKVEANGEASRRLQSRLDEGAELFKQGYAPLIAVSGGLGKEGFDEAVVMKDYLVAHSIPENVIIEDINGVNTYETAKNLREIAQDKNIESIIVVTQYYHILRAKLALKKFGFSYVYSSYAKMTPELRDLYSIPREIIGYYAYLFKDYQS
jgi:uncharacterized SAM-binding protein YcdF (DUF218 family)